MSQCDVPEASIFTYRKKTTDQYEPQQDEEHEEVQTELKTSSTYYIYSYIIISVIFG